MVKIKRFFECLLPVSICNLECPYCYIIQENRRNMRMAELKYTPEHIAEALRPDRVGGTCLISICGAGETLVQKEAVEIVKCILKKGHFVNITTNGTLTNRFLELIEVCGTDISRLHVSFSFHYLDLVKKNLVDVFFDNVRCIRTAGASILVQINLCDEYVPYIETIKELVKLNVGAYPQVALTRNEKTRPTSIFTNGAAEDYIEHGRKFNSPLFDFTLKNFLVKRKEYCYAGEWSGTLNLQTGVLTKCYAESNGINIFEDVNTPIPFEAVGKNCKSEYCINSSHFMSLGIIPSVISPTYAQLRNRKEANWYSAEMEEFLNSKLYESNQQRSFLYRAKMEINEKYWNFRHKFHRLRVSMMRKK